MTPPTTRLTDAEWLQHKPYIRRMIMDQNVSQGETRRRLKDEGVLVTKAQLEYKLKIWGFRKKAPKEKSDVLWQYVGHYVEKRKQQHKASDVFLNGQLVDPAKARKEINRHQPTSLVRLEQAGMSPKTPESLEVIIRTPASTTSQPLWPSCLPWFQFQRKIPSSWYLPKASEASRNAPVQTVTRADMPFLHSTSHVVGSLDTKDSSCLACIIDLIMPEVCSNGNASRAQLLLCGSAAEITTERLKLVLYQLSNKLVDLEINDTEWASIIDLIDKSGMAKMFLQLGEMMDTTLRSVTERLFQHAFKKLYEESQHPHWRKGCVLGSNTNSELTWDGERDEDAWWAKSPNWRIINWLLSSGQNPNTLIPLSKAPSPNNLNKTQLLTPLQVAVDILCPQLVSLLLDAKSSSTSVSDDPSISIRGILGRDVCSADRLRLLDCFMKDEATASLLAGERCSLLADALQGLGSGFLTCDSVLLDILMSNEVEGCLKSQNYPASGWTFQTCSALGYAAGLSRESVAISCFSHFLSRAQQLEPSLPAIHFIAWDVIFLATSMGHNMILDLLLDFGIDLAMYRHQGITALHVAAFFGQFVTCQTLLNIGVPVNGHPDSQHLPSPLHLAAYRGNFKIIQLLHSHGAYLTKGITLQERQSWSRSTGCMNDEGCLDDEHATSPVGAAILSCNVQSCEFFAQHGIEFPLWAACCGTSGRNFQLQIVRLALKMGADPNWIESNGFSALQNALRQSVCNGAVAMTLLDSGAVLKGGEITNAIRLKDWQLIKRLLEMESLGVSRRQDFMPALRAAIQTRGSNHLIDRLFDIYRPDTYRVHELTSILEAGITNGNQYLVDKLLGEFLLGGSQPHELRSILVADIAKGNQRLTRQILNHRPDAYDPLVLCASVIFEDHGSGIVELLLKHRPKLENAHPLESLAIGIAAWRGREDMLDLLLTKFCMTSPAALPKEMIANFKYPQYDGSYFDLFFTDSLAFFRKGWGIWRDRNLILGSPLTLALKSETSLARLLDHGFLPDRLTMSVAVGLGRDHLVRKLVRYPMPSSGFEDYEGPLAIAVRKGNVEMVKVLLDGNCCVNEDNGLVVRGRSPLQIAVEHGNLDLINTLVSAGADVNAPAARFRGATALQLAAIKGYIGVAKMLVDLGADINAPGAADEGGRTALEGAAEHGRIDTIQYLLSEGAQTNAGTRLSYLRAIRYAELEGHLVAADLLKSWREWTAEDDAIWNKIRLRSRSSCEMFIEKDTEVEDDDLSFLSDGEWEYSSERVEEYSDSGSERDSYPPEEIQGGDGSQNVVLGDAPTDEVHALEILDATNVGEIAPELVDLEMITTDTLSFWV